LREQLEFRDLDSKGIKNMLVQRLQDALDREKKETEQSDVPKSSEIDETMVVKIKEELVELMETDEAVEEV